MGVLNSVLSPSERLTYRGDGSEMIPFQNCVEHCGLVDVKYSGSFFTRNNKQEGRAHVYAKIDRVMANGQWLDKYANVEVFFFLEGYFDHTPCLVNFSSVKETRKSFRYFNFWSSYKDFHGKVAETWNDDVKGTLMFCLIRKLKRLRGVLTKFNKEGKGDVFVQDIEKYKRLIEIQAKIKEDLGNVQLMNEEIICREDYQQAYYDLIHFLKQKVKMEWLKNGDENTKVFHSSIRSWHIHNSIYSIWDVKGKLVTEQQAKFLQKAYTKDDVKAALFSIPDEKALGSDGYSSAFFKHTWDITGQDLVQSVLSFLHSGRILKKINTTTLTLIPKTSCPKNVSEYRPIACCNVVYKIATKLICSRLREILPSIIYENQSGFIQGRNIAHNIMICQDLVRGYGRKNARLACIIKIDLLKANDTLDCYIHSKRGLRQGDPMAPLLFVIGMEYLSIIMIKVAQQQDFTYHPRCESLKLTHLYFADDLLLFSRGDFKAIYVLLRGFQLFTESLGLQANKKKSAIYGVGLQEEDWAQITDMAGKYIWAIAKKEDNLWVKWVHTVYVKEDDWWSYIAPITSSWYWKRVVKTKNELMEVYMQNVISWPSYSIAKMYKLLKDKTDTRWKFSHIRDRLGIPKHKFVTWLMLKKRLSTRDRLTRYGIAQDPCCVICGQLEESHRHLFFECQFSKQCMFHILS
ncbi:uncharacterized protein LOC133778559 [Humulus lupulus]|uniref:uncharacterized protein LOC133778559 n=1 Tax=Humulus lupulus TaxID=3486 RepID=UPI002B4088FA|nr:uncharacterized protein LOC133778559 [Humulus lupulus]